MTQDEIPESFRRLLTRPRWGDGPGRERMDWLRREVLGDRPSPPTLHVVGSNGKGTEAHLAASVLRSLGLPCGLYVSPHFRRFEERVQINGEPVDAEILAEALHAADAAARHWEAEHGERFGAFEVLTGAALRVFTERFRNSASGERGVGERGVVVAEAGVGGRLDSTRVFGGRVAALTTVELEHTAVLGEDRRTIALDKAGIVPAGGVLVTAPLGDEGGVSLEREIERDLAQRGARLLRLEEACRWQVGEPCLDEAGRPRRRLDLLPGGRAGEPHERVPSYLELFLSDVSGLELPLAGRHQAVNAALAVASVAVLLEEYPALGTSGLRHEPDGQTEEKAPGGEAAVAAGERVRRGLAGARVPGRFEQLGLRNSLAVYVDVAHTPASLSALAGTARELFAGRPWGLVAGISEGRDATMLAPLVEAASWTVISRSRYRGVEAVRVAQALAHGSGRGVLPSASSVETALAMAGNWARGMDAAGEPRPVLVTGSYFLAAEAAAVWEGREPTELLFQ